MTVSQQVRNELTGVGLETDEPVITFDDPDEEVLALADTHDALATTEHLLEEVDHLTQLSQGLEELAGIGDSIQEASPMEVRLMHQATRLALLGSDVGVEMLMPSLESSVGGTISTEGLKQAAKSVWDAIVRTLKNIWEAIRNFFRGVKGDVQRVKMRNTQVRFNGENATGRAINNETTLLGREINALTTFFRAPRSAKDVILGLTEFKRQANVVYGKYCDTILDIGRRLEAEVSGFDLNNTEASLEKMVRIGEGLDLRAIASQSGKVIEMVDSRWENGTAIRASALMGTRSVVYVTPKSRGGAESLLARSEAVRNKRVSVVMSSPQATNRVSHGEVDTFPASAVVDITHLVDELMRMISQGDKKVMQLDKVHARLKAASEGLARKLEQASDLSETSRAHVRSALAFNVAYAHWASQPQSAFSSLVVSACRASLIASSKSLKNH